MKTPIDERRKQIVLLIHGIRTRAWWQGEVKALIEADTGATVIPLKYGYFDVFRFWCPLGICRQGPIARLHRELRDAIREFAGHDVSVIAHSYGTYALSRILMEHSDIALRRIILCGSIIPNTFSWSRIATQIRDQPMRDAVLNECGTKDIWPVLAASLTWGYGTSSTHGFGSVEVRDRIHAMPHGGYFDRAFVRKFWLPFLARGQIVASSVERAGTATPWWFSVLAWPWKWAAVAAVVLAIASGSLIFTLPEGGVTAVGGVAARKDIHAQDITIAGQTETSDETPVRSDNEGTGSVTSVGGVAAGGNIEAGGIRIGDEP